MKKIDKAIQVLESSDDRKEGQAALSKLTICELNWIILKMDLVSRKSVKQDIINSIIGSTIDRRLKSETFANFRPSLPGVSRRQKL